MIERPERSAEEFVRAGADSVTVHAEATPHLARAVGLIHESGAGAGVAINPAHRRRRRSPRSAARSSWRSA